MKGRVTSFLPEQKYGFLKGDDGRDYFFHVSAFARAEEAAGLCEEAAVEFEQRATPKGYKAEKCVLIQPSSLLTHITPDEFLTSRTESVKGWEIMERGRWIVHGSSRDSPDAAKRAVIENAEMVGANGIVSLDYYKTTGSEPGTGRGTHHFTIHNFRGRVVILGKRSARGKYRPEELSGMNERARAVKKEMVEKTERSKRKRNSVWLVVAICSLAVALVSPWLVIPVVFAGAIFGRSTDYDSWLRMG